MVPRASSGKRCLTARESIMHDASMPGAHVFLQKGEQMFHVRPAPSNSRFKVKPPIVVAQLLYHCMKVLKYILSVIRHTYATHISVQKVKFGLLRTFCDLICRTCSPLLFVGA